jgi:FkbM family methyltransferase
MDVKLMLRMLLLEVQQMLRRHGLETARLSLGAMFARSQSRDNSIQTVIDIGASDGRWSLVARRYFPNAGYFLIEARKEHEPALRRLKRTYHNIDYVIAAAGDINGQIYFDASHLFGGIASHTPFEQNCVIVPVTTVDQEVCRRQLKPPFLLKLDTHGFEVPIFYGAQQTLRQTRMIVVETYNFTITSDSLRFHDMCRFLEDQGFRCVDLCDPLHRPRDHALWQIDLCFMPITHAVFQSDSYW